MSLIKYIKFDYKNNKYNFIQCWQSKFKVFNIDFIENKRLDYIKINNLSINNDFYHNNKEDYEHEYYNISSERLRKKGASSAFFHSFISIFTWRTTRGP